MNPVAIGILGLVIALRILLTIQPNLISSPIARGRVNAYLQWFLGCGAAAILFTIFGARLFYVPTRSMQPTLLVGDIFIVNRLSYWLRPPRVDDIAVFRPPAQASESAEYMVKRIVASGGDTVEIRNGKLLRNHRQVAEDYLPSGTTQQNTPLFKVPPGHFFVMGDNRNNSFDSRFWKEAVPEAQFIGTADVVVFPFSRAGRRKKNPSR